MNSRRRASKIGVEVSSSINVPPEAVHKTTFRRPQGTTSRQRPIEWIHWHLSTKDIGVPRLAQARRLCADRHRQRHNPCKLHQQIQHTGMLAQMPNSSTTVIYASSAHSPHLSSHRQKEYQR